ncbi:hypothetical protein GCM10007183_00140 [Staphylococcus muscae]|uniref:Uncharacterized protein n=1 Tax=Staphylococcus muscae TaxID=1294 RepID=A0ABQ1HIZ2_9STAP|nr:hypothetical protein GCM10007183_00140 [Staphylococcus muscae]
MNLYFVVVILDYVRADKTISNHVNQGDKLTTHQFSALGQNRNMTIINELG